MFSLTRSNLLRQLPDLNEIIRRLLEVVIISNSTEIYFGNCDKILKRTDATCFH